jgi:hypothetical protein
MPGRRVKFPFPLVDLNGLAPWRASETRIVAILQDPRIKKLSASPEWIPVLGDDARVSAAWDGTMSRDFI